MGDFNQKSKTAYDKKADDYDNTFDGQFTREFKELLLLNILLQDGDTVVDVACGNGTLLKMLSAKKRIRAFGVDISEEMIKNARLACKDMTFETSGCENIPFENGIADVMTVCAAYHHFPDVRAFAKEAERILKPGGRLYIAEVYLPAPLRLICNPFVPLSKDGDVKFYSAKGICKTFAKHHFGCLEAVKKGHIQIICLQKEKGQPKNYK